MIYDKKHWNNIAKGVVEKALPIFPYIKGKKLKSEIMSNLFETQSAEYFNSIGIPTESADSDRKPDLFFTELNKPCEIKVTGINHPFVKKCKWMGGTFSKRTSDFIFVVWNHNDNTNKISLSIFKCFVDENEWNSIGDGSNYYATTFKSDQIFEREHEILLGDYDGTMINLSEVDYARPV